MTSRLPPLGKSYRRSPRFEEPTVYGSKNRIVVLPSLPNESMLNGGDDLQRVGRQRPLLRALCGVLQLLQRREAHQCCGEIWVRQYISYRGFDEVLRKSPLDDLTEPHRAGHVAGVTGSRADRVHALHA